MKNKRISFIFRKFLLFVLFQSFFVCVSFLLLKRIGAFGCFDDCFNFGAGDFILQGKQLYSQIFFNHQPFMAYISAAVQYLTHPETLFELVKYHRIAAFVFADICGSLLLFRFGFPVLVSLIVFESTKFYLFGDRFLAEGFIVYPMMYLILLIGQIVLKKKIYRWEYILAALCSWFIFWMREPFIPWSGIALGIVYVLAYREKEQRKYIVPSILVFGMLHIATVLFLPMQDYIFNVITTNLQHEVGVQTWTLYTIVQIIAYPLFVILSGFGNLFQNILLIVSVVFCVAVGYEIFLRKKILLPMIVAGLLAAANLRVVPVGTMYYDAFHLIPWYGLFIVSITLFMEDMRKQKTGKRYGVVAGMAVLWIAALTVLSSQSFVNETVDTQIEFTTGYGNYFVKGEVIKILAKDGDTMFVEMWEDPIYFVAGVPTAYKYSWYTSIMPKFPIYEQARQDMFVKYAPTFYVGACKEEEIDSFALSETNKTKYEQLLNSGKPSCVYVMKNRILTISEDQKNQLSLFGYTLPKEER